MMISAIESNQALLIEELEKKQEAAEKKAQEFVSKLEQEINELQRRRNELLYLGDTNDMLHLLRVRFLMDSVSYIRKVMLICKDTLYKKVRLIHALN